MVQKVRYSVMNTPIQNSVATEIASWQLKLRSRSLKAVIRHYSTPEPNACRYCGYEQRSHAIRWIRSVGSHNWVIPTDKQRLARMKARRSASLGAFREQN